MIIRVIDLITDRYANYNDRCPLYSGQSDQVIICLSPDDYNGALHHLAANCLFGVGHFTGRDFNFVIPRLEADRRGLVPGDVLSGYKA